MASVPDTNTVIQIAIISQYLANRSIASKKFYNGQPIDPKRPELIYITRKDVQWAYTINPSDPTLVKAGTYLFALCAPFSQQALNIISNTSQSLPVITGPSNQAGLVGFNATFSVIVVSTLPVTYQWYDGFGNIIVGATSASYVFSNAQLTDNGKHFFVRVSNSAGITISATATLTVTAALTGFLYYSDNDPGPALSSNNDPFTYQESLSITHNANISVPIPSAATPNKYLVVKIPDGETSKTIWNNTPLNNGIIPDSVFQTPVSFGGFTYYYTRVAVSLDNSVPLILS